MLKGLIAVFLALICLFPIYAQETTIKKGIQDPDFYVDIYKPEKAYNGTTLFADYHDPQNPRIIEVNMQGEIVWQYLLPQGLKHYTNPGFDVEYLPNNHILFLLPMKGIFEINHEGKIVWSHLDKNVSHDADRLPNGNTLYVFGGDDQIEDAQVKEINPEGEIVWSWFAKDYFYKPPYKDIYDGGWTHTNSVTRLPNGNTLISLRNFNLLAEVNLKGTVVWLFDWGELGDHAHEPELQSNGNILVALFKRKGPGLPPPNRAVEVNTKTGEIVWEFELGGIRDADRLANGNILITGGIQIAEVTPQGEVVWRLNLKGITLERQDHPKWIYRAQRIST